MCMQVERSLSLNPPDLSIDARERRKTGVLQITFGLESYTEGILLSHHNTMFCIPHTLTTSVD